MTQSESSNRDIGPPPIPNVMDCSARTSTSTPVTTTPTAPTSTTVPSPAPTSSSGASTSAVLSSTQVSSPATSPTSDANNNVASTSTQPTSFVVGNLAPAGSSTQNSTTDVGVAVVTVSVSSSSINTAALSPAEGAPPKKAESSSIGLIAGIAGGVALIVFLLMLWFCIRKRRAKRRKEQEAPYNQHYTDSYINDTDHYAYEDSTGLIHNGNDSYPRINSESYNKAPVIPVQGFVPRRNSSSSFGGTDHASVSTPIVAASGNHGYPSDVKQANGEYPEHNFAPGPPPPPPPPPSAPAKNFAQNSPLAAPRTASPLTKSPMYYDDPRGHLQQASVYDDDEPREMMMSPRMKQKFQPNKHYEQSVDSSDDFNPPVQVQKKAQPQMTRPESYQTYESRYSKLTSAQGQPESLYFGDRATLHNYPGKPQRHSDASWGLPVDIDSVSRRG